MKTLSRCYHPWWKWECYRAGFFKTLPPGGLEKRAALRVYKEFLSDLKRFEDAVLRVFTEWPYSCEQFLTNPGMNRVAWIGQASLCIETGIPSAFRGGYKLLSCSKQKAADALAKKYLEYWLGGKWRTQLKR